jgi:hypothetical protein
MSSLCSVSSGPRARVIWRLALAFALVALTALALSGAIESLQSGAMMVLPALALAVVMLVRPYLGEGAIARLHARRQRRPRTVGPVAVRPRPHAGIARGGRLIAMSLAGRAPPFAFAGCR